MVGNGRTSEKSNRGGESAILTNSQMFLQPADLLPGDVLIYRSSKPNWVQKKISDSTDSPYTHAGIYLGEGLVAEANFPNGVERKELLNSIYGSRCVAVLRTQLGFQAERSAKLLEFVDSVVGHRRFYDLSVVKFQRVENDHLDGLLKHVEENYGNVTSSEEFAKQSFFCSAFVVACFIVVEIIGDTAQILYKPRAFSPGDLYLEPTFGWLLGYLVPEGGSVPVDDPVLIHGTRWSDNMSIRWWP